MQIIDLSHNINSEISVFPGDKKPILFPLSTVKKDGYAQMLLSINTHTATHIDAPCHILLDGKTLNDFPIEKFYGSAMSIDCTWVKGEKIVLKSIKKYADQLAKVDFVLFNTGWSNKWQMDTYCGKYPTLTHESAQWLTQFNLKGVGVDTISVDEVESVALPNHHALLEKEILIIENLKDMSKLGEGQFTLSCFPLKIDKTDGSPVRAVGIKHSEPAFEGK